MKKLGALLLIILLLLSACGNNDFTSSGDIGRDDNHASSESEQERSIPEESSNEPIPAVQEQVKTIGIQGGTATALAEKSSLLDFALPEEILFKSEAWGNELKPGMTATIGYNGIVAQSYPGQIHVDTMSVEAYDDGLLSMFFDILEDIYNHFNWQCQDAEYIGVDLTQVYYLSQGEKEAVAWLFANRHGAEPVCGSFWEIEEQGYLDPESNNKWENGVLLQVKMLETLEDSFEIQCGVWKEGDTYDIYGMDAIKENGLWGAEKNGSEGFASFINIYPQGKTTSDDLPGLYRNILTILNSVNSPLNEDMKYFGFDTGNVDHLSQEEWEALGREFAEAYHMEAVFGTVDELEEQGYFDLESDGGWSDGVLFQLNITHEDGDSFVLDCNKWRGLLAARGFEMTVTKTDGKWVAEKTGAEYIS